MGVRPTFDCLQRIGKEERGASTSVSCCNWMEVFMNGWKDEARAGA